MSWARQIARPSLLSGLLTVHFRNELNVQDIRIFAHICPARRNVTSSEVSG